MAANVVANMTPTSLLASITGKSTTTEPQPAQPQHETANTGSSEQATVVRINMDEDSISPLQSFEDQDMTPVNTEDTKEQQDTSQQNKDEEPPFNIHDRKEFPIMLSTGDTSSLDPNADAFQPVQSKQA